MQIYRQNPPKKGVLAYTLLPHQLGLCIIIIKTI